MSKATIEEDVKEEVPDGFIEMPTAEEVPETPEPTETPVVEEEPTEIPEEPEEPAKPETPEKPEEPEKPAFKFADTEEEPEDQPDKPFIVLKRHGKEVPIWTEEEARNRLQKDLDYDIKVGPHAKIARIMDEYPDFAKQVASNWDAYVAGKQTPPTVEKPELKSLNDFEDANDWFWDNYSKVREHEDSQKPAVQESEPEVPAWVSSLVAHDPQGFTTVAPQIQSLAAKHLSKYDYDRVNNDLPSLIQFYDYAKKNLITTKSKAAIPDKPNEPAYRMKSGGGEAPNADEKPVWESHNNDEFEEYMANVKGVASYQ